MLEQKTQIRYDDFAKIDLRVATVLEAEIHPDADKLIILKIDLGDHQRQIVAGLRPFYTPEEVVGKQIVVVVNLEPSKMRGAVSQGMLLAALDRESDEKTMAFATPERKMLPGTRVS